MDCGRRRVGAGSLNPAQEVDVSGDGVDRISMRSMKILLESQEKGLVSAKEGSFEEGEAKNANLHHIKI